MSIFLMDDISDRIGREKSLVIVEVMTEQRPKTMVCKGKGIIVWLKGIER